MKFPDILGRKPNQETTLTDTDIDSSPRPPRLPGGPLQSKPAYDEQRNSWLSPTGEMIDPSDALTQTLQVAKERNQQFTPGEVTDIWNRVNNPKAK